MHRLLVKGAGSSNGADVASIVGRRGTVLGADLVFHFTRMFDARAAADRLERARLALPGVEWIVSPFERPSR